MPVNCLNLFLFPSSKCTSMSFYREFLIPLRAPAVSDVAAAVCASVGYAKSQSIHALPTLSSHSGWSICPTTGIDISVGLTACEYKEFVPHGFLGNVSFLVTLWSCCVCLQLSLLYYFLRNHLGNADIYQTGLVICSALLYKGSLNLNLSYMLISVSSLFYISVHIINTL